MSICPYLLDFILSTKSLGKKKICIKDIKVLTYIQRNGNDIK